MTISRIRGLKYFGSSVTLTVEPNTFYSYTLDDAASAPSIVAQLAGVGKLGF
jgi:hypothetical protein